ncbi:MAG: hypothetical protein ACFHWX_20970 [Bacteroidota bacterium]
MESIIKYFEGERLQCIIGAVISILFISSSVYFLISHKSLFKGMAYVFLPLSLFLLVICIGVILRTPKDIERVGSFYQSAPEKIETEELPRMQKVMKSFGIIKKVEIGLILIGLLLLIIFWQGDLYKGVGLGLTIIGVVLYIFDHLAEARGIVYFDFLKSL